MSDVEDLVAAWQRRLATVTANINELSSAESTKRIRIRAREGHYAGLTKQRADAALTRLGALSDDYLLLARVVQEALDTQHGGLFVTRESRREKVQALLEGNSIVRAAEAVPLRNRSLLEAAVGQITMTPGDLLAQMQCSFVAVRDALADIDGAESAAQTGLAQLRSDYAHLDARAAQLQAATERPSFVELQDLQTDPLNARDGMASIGRGLAAWAAMLDRLEAAHAQADAGLARAKAAVAELRGVSAAWQAQAQHVQALFGDTGAQALTPAPIEQLGMLESWCDALEGSLKMGQWDAVNVGLSRIEAALGEALARSRQAVADAQARCAEADEIKGQFTALKAKEHVLAAQLQREFDSAALRERITLALAERPLDMAAARACLRQYQSLLSTLNH